MNTKTVLIAGALISALLLLLVAACGGDGDGGGDEAGIRTSKGLSVAALSASLQAGSGGESEDDAAADQGGAAPAPATSGGAAYDRGGMIAPDIYPYPFQATQGSLSGITVQGYGSASVEADGAVLEFYFYSTSGGGVEPVPSERDSSSGSSGGAESGAPDVAVSGQAAPITEADLQPVVDAIAGAGVPRDNIEVVVQPSYGDIYSGGSATVRATIEGTGSLSAIVDAATSAAIPANISFSGTGVSYTVSDCPALETAAMEAAVADARERGASFASSLGVGLGDVVGASSYSYSAYGSPCDGTTFGGPYPLSGVAYAETQASEVSLLATVTVTFAME
jgi:uncharacterized protein YggE